MPDMGVGDEFHAFGFHLLKTAVEDALLHFEFGNAVAQKSTNTISLFVHSNPVACAIQLLRCRQPCRA